MKIFHTPFRKNYENREDKHIGQLHDSASSVETLIGYKLLSPLLITTNHMNYSVIHDTFNWNLCDEYFSEFYVTKRCHKCYLEK